MPNLFSILNDEDDDDIIIQKDKVADKLEVKLEVNLEDKQIKNKMKLPPEFSETIQKHDFTESTNKLNELPNKFKTLPSEFFEGSDSIAWSNKIKSKKVFSQPYIDNSKVELKTDFKKKSFTQATVKKADTIKLPEYYKMRLGEEKNIYEIPQCEYDWIKRIGALEKSKSVIDMWTGVMSCSIAYFENKQFLQRNQYFINKITPDFAYNNKQQEELIEIICIQTTSILFHRLIKSDSIDTIKLLLKSLPLYKAVSGNPVDMTNLSRSTGANAYLRIKYNYMNDLRIVQNKKGNSNNKEIELALLRTKEKENEWLNYILQSVWNGNNPIHDCLYYGTNQSFECLLEHYYRLDLLTELQKMMLEPNIQNETHLDIVKNGKKACEKHSSFIIRNAQFEECEKLYNRIITNLLTYKKPNEQKEIQNEITENNDSDGDNVNVYSLINSGDIDGMIAHINRNKDNKEIIQKTLEIWQTAVDGDKTGQLVDYLDDLKYQVKSIL